MKQPLDLKKVAVWQLTFRFSTAIVPDGQGIHFVRALANEPTRQRYDRIFDEVDAELRTEYGDYQLLSCNIRPVIMNGL
ncbi:MAG: hypothetical protein K0S90_562 [Enterobacteriaceae bacterium]|jgi:hypothetical protein|uniref:hypothetical protein n=1 Tax=Pseudescherichia sp. TaxID=2055881 RepID=UPI00289F02E7|nr:hypothetical protein [Pseudescherichia sp.]MDF2777039.1 hypothetical protein [Enterobacteriaceae bacterium]